MSYGTVDGVQKLLAPFGVSAFSSASKPPLSEVEAWIEDTEAEIDGVLTGQGYATIPATGANDTDMLRPRVQEKVAAKAYSIIFVNKEFPDTVKMWLQDYKDFLSRLGSGKQRLKDQAPTSLRSGVPVMIRGKRWTGN